MSTTEWFEFIDFVSNILWLLVAWVSGLILGYIVGFRNGGDM